MIALSSIKSLDGLPENIRSLFVEADGVISLDETKVRTETDVANVQRAKEKERDAANAARAELAKYREFGATPDELADRIAELELRGGKGSEQTEKIAALQRELRQTKTEYDTVKGELDAIKPEFEQTKTMYRKQKTESVLSDFVKTLKNVDADRLQRSLRKDVMLGLLELDESGEGLVCKDGSRLEDYAMSVAKDFGFVTGNTPDRSSPGTARISPVADRNADNRQVAPIADRNVLDDDVTSKLDN